MHFSYFLSSGLVESLFLNVSNLLDLRVHARLSETVENHIVDDGGNRPTEVHERINGLLQVCADLLVVEVSEVFKTNAVLSLRIVWMLHRTGQK